MKAKLRPPMLTKLQPPAVARQIIPRRLLADFGETLLSHQLTLICAAAGYGKTTLLSTLCQAAVPVAWYHLGRSDADPAVFMNYLREALRLALRDDALPLLTNIPKRARTRDDLDAHLTHFVNCLSEVPRPHIIVVLDDFHAVEESKSLLWFLNRLIASLPVNTHLVLSSRTTFSLSAVPKLRVSGQVLDIREYDLRFDANEAAQLLEKNHRVTLPLEMINSLVEHTEGWPIGLNLAAQSLSRLPFSDIEDFLSQLSRTDQPLFEYLAEEVFSQQSADLQEFLLLSSILTQIDEDTCNAILGRGDSGTMLRRILRGNLFLSSTNQTVLRYHQLFRDFLRQRLSQNPEEFVRIHESAALHFHRSGNEALSVYHLVAAKRYHQAASLISASCDHLVTTSRFDTLAFWIEQLPEHVLENFPELLFRRGEIDHIRGRYDSSLQWYDRAARVYRARDDKVGLSRVMQRKGRILNWRVGEPQSAEALHSQALSYLRDEDKVERAALLADLARDRMSGGELNLGFQLFQQAVQMYEELGEAGREGLLITLINPGSWLYFDRGDFFQSLALLQKAAVIARELDCKHQLAECYNTMSSHLFLWGKVEESRAYAEKALELCRELGSDFGQGVALMNLANVIEDEGGQRSDEYLKWHQRALEVFETAGNRRFCIATLNFMSTACRRRGRMVQAAKYAQQALALARSGSASWLTAWSMSNVGAAAVESNVDQAVDLLERAMDTFRNYGDKHNLTQVHLWLAAALNKTKTIAWSDHLRTSLELAREGQYGHTIKRERRFSLPLLLDALRNGHVNDYVGDALVEFGDEILEYLQQIIENGGSQGGIGAVRVLSAMESRSAWKTLFACARHAHEAVRSAALAALAGLPAPSPPLLDIYCLGPFRVYCGATLIAEEDWKRKKVKSLLKYLVDSPNGRASKDEIIEALWPDLDPDAGSNNFYRTLHHLRRLLEQNGGHIDCNYVFFDGGVVGLTADLVARIDVNDFERFVRKAKNEAATGELESAGLIWQAAVQLYKGDFLADDPYEDWPQPRREQLRDLFVSALEGLSELQAKRQNWDAACEYLRRILALDCAREDIYLRLMQILATSGNYSEAIKQYRRCEQVLREELDAEPAAETRAFYAQLAHRQS